jgi:hypothetical protein
VILSNGSKLRDFEIPVGVISGALSPEDRRKYEFHTDALGGLWFLENDAFVHGWLHISSEIQNAVWDQVSAGGYEESMICLGVEPIENDKWSGNPLSILSVSFNFTRTPIPPKQQARQKPWWRRW